MTVLQPQSVEKEANQHKSSQAHIPTFSESTVVESCLYRCYSVCCKDSAIPWEPWGRYLGQVGVKKRSYELRVAAVVYTEVYTRYYMYIWRPRDSHVVSVVCWHKHHLRGSWLVLWPKSMLDFGINTAPLSQCSD